MTLPMTPPTDLGVEPARIGNPHRVPARLVQVLRSAEMCRATARAVS
jgi:hypothetical protein